MADHLEMIYKKYVKPLSTTERIRLLEMTIQELAHTAPQVPVKLKTQKKEKVLEALAQTHGIWKDDEGIAAAFREVEKEWDEWQKKIEAY